jgi:hypothetical protein
MNDLPSTRPKGDPILEQLVAWRRSPSEDATVALCERLRKDAAKEAEVLYVARTIEQLHGRSVRVLLALGRLQLARGLLAQAQRTFVLAGRAECASSSKIKNAALGSQPTIPMAGDPQQQTNARKPSSLLLDVLCKIDDDEAITAVAGLARAMPPPLPKRKAG